ncbi:flagellar basal-body MS-ring/collar protein FliF [Nitrosomonas aestuarii]|uniref:flagellar basal-body MS-ring/collar protein FliF n=1 Tax=Nitrosomonas aestuarii TaxID=52441 RepID=UPI000D312064|nr:flagellar basal-body MS-ring/collar protein FliF [Nitrosomonas aestuarii]PTN11606.1 flagellar M-ring protein FliF [Nitrosomonas aestuarii]
MATIPSETNTAKKVQPSTSFGLDKFIQLSNQNKLGFMVAIAAIIALLAGAWMWSQSPDYRVLYSNISDQDGADIINSLQQTNVPYKFSQSGSAILIPSDQVHEARLRLAGQGLPRGGLAGFELMENQKFGASQFLEQVNYQRALEGELSRTVQSLSAVQSARIHLAISKPSVFARERQKPSVSVLLNLYPGRMLAEEQVSAIVHLVSSSIPSLSVQNVTVVDQNGNLLSGQEQTKPESKFDANQLEYLHELEKSYSRRIEAILSPITGATNVHAQVTADLDFSRIERAEEIYRPNNTETEAASIRSQQTMESMSTGNKIDGGIPGALTNRPPEPAIAPIEIEGEDGEQKPEPLPSDQRKESTTNYEVDKTVQHTHLPTGNIKRLSAAVVVNYRKTVGEDGNITHVPLSEVEIREINNLVKDAMGYNEDRGDTLTVTNSLFSDADNTALAVPLWKDPDMILLAQEIGKQLLIAAIVVFFLLKILRPFLKSLAHNPELKEKKLTELPNDAAVDAMGQPLKLAEDGTPLLDKSLTEEEVRKNAFGKNLQKAKQLAIDEPAIVANVVKEWVNGNG